MNMIQHIPHTLMVHNFIQSYFSHTLIFIANHLLEYDYYSIVINNYDHPVLHAQTTRDAL